MQNKIFFWVIGSGTVSVLVVFVGGYILTKTPTINQIIESPITKIQSPATSSGVDNVSSLSPMLNKENEYAGWKTFASPFGYSIQYPPEWYLQKMAGEETFIRVQSWQITNEREVRPGNGGALSIVTSVGISQKDFEAFAKRGLKNDDSITTSNLSGSRIYRVKHADGREEIFASNGGRAFMLRLQDAVLESDNKSQEILQKVVSSFVLTTPKETYDEERARVLKTVLQMTPTQRTDFLDKERVQAQDFFLRESAKIVQFALEWYKNNYLNGGGKYPKTLNELYGTAINRATPDEYDLKLMQNSTYTVLSNGQDYHFIIHFSTSTLELTRDNQISGYYDD